MLLVLVVLVAPDGGAHRLGPLRPREIHQVHLGLLLQVLPGTFGVEVELGVADGHVTTVALQRTYMFNGGRMDVPCVETVLNQPCPLFPTLKLIPLVHVDSVCFLPLHKSCGHAPANPMPTSECRRLIKITAWSKRMDNSAQCNFTCQLGVSSIYECFARTALFCSRFGFYLACSSQCDTSVKPELVIQSRILRLACCRA
jgi:hypothetical protein